MMTIYVNTKEILGNGKVMGKKLLLMKRPKPNSDIIGEPLICQLSVYMK
jgi:hypothetical protein